MSETVSDAPVEIINPPAHVIEVRGSVPNLVPERLQKYVINPPCFGNDFELGDIEPSCQRQRWVNTQLEALEMQGMKSPADDCVRAVDYKKILDGDHAYSRVEFSNSQAWLVDIMKRPYQHSQLARKFVAAAAFNNMLICNHRDPEEGGPFDVRGSFDTATSVIGINRPVIHEISRAMYGYDTEASALDAIDQKIQNEIEIISHNQGESVALEEFGHAYQTAAINQDLILGNANYALNDLVLWGLSMEAHAKLSYIVDVLRNASKAVDDKNTEGLLFAQDIFVSLSMHEEAEYQMMNYLMGQVTAKDLEALSNPDVLYNAFTLFFKNKRSMQSYFDPEGLEEFIDDSATQRIDIIKFERAFGHILGDEYSDVNFLKGRFKNADDIKALIPKEYPVRHWLDRNEGPIVLTNEECVERLGRQAPMDRVICEPR